MLVLWRTVLLLFALGITLRNDAFGGVWPLLR